MKIILAGLSTLIAGSFLIAGSQGGQNKADDAATKVELKRVHMCCDGCAKEVADTLKNVPGIKDVTVDQETKTARFTAPDTNGAQKAVDALAGGGFHGNSGSKDYSFKDDSGV